MENEEILSTTGTTEMETQEQKAEPEKEANETPKTYSEEEYKKAQQSAASKAKYELLKEFGVKGVDDFRNKVKEADDAIKEKESFVTQLEERDNKIKELNQKMVIKELGVAEDFTEDLITLAQKKISDTVDFKAACEQVLERNPSWRSGKSPVKLGTEKSEPTPTDELNAKLHKKYDWIK